MNWVPGAVALVLVLYMAKAVILDQRPRLSAACLWFIPLLALAVPVTWAIDPDWNNPNLYPIAHWVGTPIAILAVPAVSFFIDLWVLSDGGRQRSPWWVLPELFVACPAWFFFWLLFSFWVLGWGWI
jgi:hypothetical protein